MIPALLLACTVAPPADPPSAPVPEVAPVNAPPIDDALLTWMETHGDGRTFEVPLEIVSAPLSRTSHIIGPEGRYAVRLDTTALSMTLDQHLAAHCTGDGPCRVWVRVTWGPLLGSIDTDPALTVRKVLGPADGTDTAIRIVE